MKIFSSQESRYIIKSALLITLVPALMLGVVVYSIWLVVVLNHSYFKSIGLQLDEASLETFFMFTIRSQVDYLPLIGLFFVGVFFLGMFMAHLVLRPFKEVERTCEHILDGTYKESKYQGLNSKKLLIQLGSYLNAYYLARKGGKSAKMPETLMNVKGPTTDLVFYFQFFCLFFALTMVTVTSIYVFTHQLHEDTIALAFGLNKLPKGSSVFLNYQSDIIHVIILVPCLISCILFGLISRLMISKVEGVTYAYIRDVREVTSGNTNRRLSPRADDPGRETADAINRLLDNIHPQVKVAEEVVVSGAPHPVPT
jgi:hypothetical protein